MSNRAILYLRSSKDRSDVSIDVQRRALHDVAVQRGLVVVDEAVDAVESGKDEDRPGFQRLLAGLKNSSRGWEHVLVLDTSRVARRRTIAMLFEQEAQRRGIKVIYRNVPDTDAVTEMLLKSILQAMDEWHSLTSKQKGLAGMAENVRQGWRAGGRAPRGYKLDYHSTGAVRDGAPVLKSRLVLDSDAADQVRAYLQLRAQGISRGVAIAKLQLPWPASSTHSMDWQALTYAGHTVWGMHAEREGGGTVAGEKRRPRAEWQVQRGTHPALISDVEAEAILGQQERALQGRRVRATPLLLSGLLETPDGISWQSDGEGFYRTASKGRRIGAPKLEAYVLEKVPQHLASDEAVGHIRAAMLDLAGGALIDGRTLAGLEKRISTLTTQIGRTVDLAADMDEPAPVLRRVADLELQRAQLVDELASLRVRQAQQEHAAHVDDNQVRALLKRYFAELISLGTKEEAQRARARQALSDVLERIVLDPATLSVRLHFAVRTGVNLASPRGFEPL